MSSTEVFATVGMNQAPFDRLVEALTPLCSQYRVYAQIGTSRVRPPCPHVPFLSFNEFQDRLRRADVVITHAGNTVRLVQRLGKVPIAVPRRACYGEMGNDHQAEYLRVEERSGRVVAAWDADRLLDMVRAHETLQRRLLLQRALPAAISEDKVVGTLDALWARLVANPFRHPHVRRYEYAWNQLAGRQGRHLDLGCGSGEFLAALAASTSLECTGVDPHRESIVKARARSPGLDVRPISPGRALPFADGSFESVSALDVLEHTPEETRTLAEVHRVLSPSGLLVATVPARHLFSSLDPDNARFRIPRVHRLVYSLRWGREKYHRRFVDLTDGLRGDLSATREEHRNYRREDLRRLIRGSGFDIVDEDGAGLFERFLQVPSLFVGGSARRLLERGMAADGRLFSSANLFVAAKRVP